MHSLPPCARQESVRALRAEVAGLQARLDAVLAERDAATAARDAARAEKTVSSIRIACVVGRDCGTRSQWMKSSFAVLMARQPRMDKLTILLSRSSDPLSS